jgi:tetratricopeptide (TPR) repeat protein
MKSVFSKAISLIFLTLLSSEALAQHSIEVEKKAQSGEWLEALTIYRQMPSRKVTSTAALAAAKSAWALGLVDDAKKEYDKALALDATAQALSDDARARIYFSRGIIEFQEGNYQASIVFAEKADGLVIEEGPLKSEIAQLWGEALYKSNKPQIALRKLEWALQHVSADNAGDLHYNIASAAMSIGQLDKAEEHLTLIPINHSKSGLAIKALASIALENKKYREVIFWLTKGRTEYPDTFLDSWVDYALTRSYAATGDSQKVVETSEKASSIYPPSDGWLILLQSAAEQARWESDAAMMARMNQKSQGRSVEVGRGK